MTPDEYERLKAQEREHLEKMRDLKRAVGQLERQRSVANALAKLQDSANDLMKRNTELVDRIARETAYLEARSEIGLEVEQTRKPDEPGIDEEELQRLRAQRLIETIKQEALSPTEPSPQSEPRTDHVVEEKKLPEDAPEKTIGRMR